MAESDFDFAIALSIQEHFDEMKSVSKKRPNDTDKEEEDVELICVEKKPKCSIDNESGSQDDDADLSYAIALSLEETNTTEDESFAISLHQQLNKDTDDIGSVELREKMWDPKSVVDKEWELIDPHPNIHDLFVQFDAMFFNSMLTNAGVAVQWGPRMTLCAGLCCYEGRGGLCSIRLSAPLLKLRPRKDLVETLLHEMIHALLFVTANRKDRESHGPEFLKHMHRINKATGANITVYHSFHDEVNLYRQHWWKCDGPCQHKPPFYGTVRRAINRAPSRHDNWWEEHQRTCGGKFIKVKEPEGYSNKKKPKKKDNSRNILEMLKTSDNKPVSSSNDPGNQVINLISDDDELCISDDIDQKRRKMAEAAEKRLKTSQTKALPHTNLPSSTTRDVRDFMERKSHIPTNKSTDSQPKSSNHSNTSLNSTKPNKDHTPNIPSSSGSGQKTIEKRTCPVCGREDIPATTINIHINFCLEEMELSEEDE